MAAMHDEQTQSPETRVPGWLAALVLAALLVVVGAGGYLLRGALTPTAMPVGEVVDAEVEKWTRASVEDPESVSVRLDLAYALQKAGEYDRALEEYAWVLRREPANVTAHFQQGAIYLELGLDKDGETSLWRALEAEPEHVQTASALGRYYASKGQYRSLLIAVRPAAVEHPGSAELQYLMGLAYEKLGEAQWAEARYRMAIEAAPDHIEAHEGLIRLGVSLTGEGR